MVMPGGPGGEMKSCRVLRGSVFMAVLAGLLAIGPADARAEMLLNPSIASHFQVTTFATGLNFPKSVQTLSDGSLLVGTTNTPNGNFFSSQATGSLLRLVDSNNDGQADGPPQVLYSGIPGGLQSVRQAGDLVFVSNGTAITVLRAGATPDAPLTLAGSINLAYPAGWEHTTSGMAVREVAGQPGNYELYFNVGSQNNATASTSSVTASGLASGSLNGDSIYRVIVHDGGGTPTVTDLTQIAAGLRNASGITFNPTNGDLLFVDNGIDGLVDVTEPFSTDELNRIAAAQIGGAVENFGFPNDYIPYRTGGQGVPGDNPLVAFQPLPNPLNGSESEGPAEIAFTPDSFKSILGEGVFVGFHGQFNLGGVANEENPLVYYNLATDSYFHFIENDQLVGHLDGLWATHDALFLADFSTTGSVNRGNGLGAIYLIRALDTQPVPEPATLVLLVSGAGALLAVRRRA